MIVDGAKCEEGSMTFSIAIDGTKVPRSMTFSAAHKCMMGRCHPNHAIDERNSSKEETDVIVNEKHEDLAAETKVATICLQNTLKGSIPMAIASARPQGVNEV